MNNHQHFKMYKPDGYLTQFIYTGRKRNKKLLGELYNFPEGTMAIGRLDQDSEGLLLLTTNGKVSNAIAGGKHIEKEYFVQVDGVITQEKVNEIKEGVEISLQGVKYTTQPCEVNILDYEPSFPLRNKNLRHPKHGPTSWISVIITEGKFRQVRKMTSAVGLPTLRLVRVRIGDIKLGNLEKGEVKKFEKLF